MMKNKELKHLRKKKKEFEGRIEEVNMVGNIFTIKTVLEERVKMFNHVKERNVAS